MAWKNYASMSPDEKKASWGKFRERSALKKKREIASRMGEQKGFESHMKLGHSGNNPGGYCNDCGYGRDHS